jgi:hypothetical protein
MRVKIARPTAGTVESQAGGSRPRAGATARPVCPPTTSSSDSGSSSASRSPHSLSPRAFASPRSSCSCPPASWPASRTDDVDPAKLLGALYQPFVSVAVGVVLFEAGLRLSLRDVAPDVRRTVARLTGIGVLVTWAGVAATAALLFDGFGVGVPLLFGAVLVVSGPTVVLPLLAFVRPAHHLRTLLMWEGVLVDPVGALLGVLVFGAVRSAATGDRVWHPGSMLLSLAVGARVGIAGASLSARSSVSPAPRSSGCCSARHSARRHGRRSRRRSWSSSPRSSSPT